MWECLSCQLNSLYFPVWGRDRHKALASGLSSASCSTHQGVVTSIKGFHDGQGKGEHAAVVAVAVIIAAAVVLVVVVVTPPPPRRPLLVGGGRSGNNDDDNDDNDTTTTTTTTTTTKAITGGSASRSSFRSRSSPISMGWLESRMRWQWRPSEETRETVGAG